MAKDEKRKRGPWFAFLILVVLWIIGGSIQAALWQYFDEDRTNQVMMVWIIAPTLAFCTLVWFTFFSEFRIKTRLFAWGGLVLALGVFVVLFEIEFSGGFVPKFHYRFRVTPEEKFLAARKAEAKYDGDLPVLADIDQPLEIRPGDWPQFRGPNGDGVVSDPVFRKNWGGEKPRLLWKKRVGPGWSSFAIVDGLVFTQEQIGEDEAVVCYEMESGKQVWQPEPHLEKGVRFEEFRMGVGPMATPLFYRGRLYTLGATGILNCLNPKTGAEFWSTDILEDADSQNVTWGMSGSPVAHEDMILVNPGSDDDDETAVAAYDWKTGKKLFAGGSHRASYATPVVAELDGVKQILMFDGLGLSGHSLENGSQLWHFKWGNIHDINVAKPIVRDDESVFISTGYGTGSALLRVKRNGQDDWSVETTDWETNSKFKLKFGDAVVKNGLIYALSETILMCLEFETGKILWRKRGDYGFGQLILVNDVLVILTDEGKVSLVEASPDHPELLRFEAIEGKTWGHPAYAQGRLFVRNAEWMACFDMRQPEAAESKSETTSEPESQEK